MMQVVSVENRYDHGLGVVYSAFCKPEFYAGKFEAIGDRDVEVTDHGEDDDGFWIETKREVPADVPGVLKKILNEWNSLTQTENWSPDGDAYRNELELLTSGVPITITGTMRLSGDDETCVNRIEMRLSSSMPFLGGQLEKFASTRTRKGLNDEFEFIREYLDA